MIYSMDLCEHAVQAVDQGGSIVQVLCRYRVDRLTVRDWRHRQHRNNLKLASPGPKRLRKLIADDLRTLRQTVAAQPGIWAKQLMPLFNVRVDKSTV